MRTVDRATFLQLPAGTVFAKYEPQVLDEVCIREDTVHGDFVVQHLDPWFEGYDDSLAYHDVLEAMRLGATSPPVDYEYCGRDGLFDDDQMFAVWDKADVMALIARLQKALGDGYGVG